MVPRRRRYPPLALSGRRPDHAAQAAICQSIGQINEGETGIAGLLDPPIARGIDWEPARIVIERRLLSAGRHDRPRAPPGGQNAVEVRFPDIENPAANRLHGVAVLSPVEGVARRASRPSRTTG